MHWLVALLLAQVYAVSPTNNGGLSAAQVQATGVSAVLPGTYTVATLPSAAGNQAHYAFVTDLGGGADMVLSDGTNWKHIRPGVITNIPIQSTITITPLQSPPVIQLQGNAFSGTSTVNVAATNLYPGYSFSLVVPSGVLSTVTGALGTVGVSVGGGTTLPIAGGMWEDFQWNGTTMIELRKGTL